MKSIRAEYPFLQSLLEALATHLGNSTEIVLHDYSEPIDKSIVAIENGHITNRRVGDCGSSFSLETVRDGRSKENRYNYLTRYDGRLLRSSSLYIHNEKGQAIGSICINSDITDLVMAEKTLQKLISIPEGEQPKETFANDVNVLLEALIAESIEYVGVPIAKMDKDQKVSGLKYLDAKGAFLIKKAGDKIAKEYNISKYTIYNYLEK